MVVEYIFTTTTLGHIYVYFSFSIDPFRTTPCNTTTRALIVLKMGGVTCEKYIQNHNSKCHRSIDIYAADDRSLLQSFDILLMGRVFRFDDVIVILFKQYIRSNIL